uniref:Putative secretory peptide-31 n=1 Tax=Pleurobrachia bachei TaxID=34499 RepID=M4H263_PLEBA|nr:putative secretory peptide-31 [Pleurobrachia bachei]|eukprot:sb/3464942/
MKLFLTILLGLLACSTYAAPLTPEQELQSIADFLERVKEIYSTLKARGAEFVCSAKLHELLDILGLPDELDGAVQLAQSWMCGGDDVVTSVASADIALQGWMDKMKEIYNTLKTYGYELVCGASLHELLDILGLPDQLDGAVSMAQGWICDEESKMTKREVAIVGGFSDWFWETVSKLKEYGTGIVCTAKLQDLMDLLGLPDLLDGAVKMAQDYICGGDEGLKTTSLQTIYVSGFIDTVKRIFASFKTYGYDLVCGASLHDLLDILGLPDQLDGAVTMAQGWFCDDEEVTPEKRSPLVISPAMELAAVKGFYDTVEHMYQLLKQYVVSFVCSAKLHQLLDLLGVPDDLDGAVSLAQKMICGLTSTALASANDMRGFFDSIEEIFYKLVEMGKAYVCGDGMIPAILEELGLPDTMTWAVNVAVGWLCN